MVCIFGDPVLAEVALGTRRVDGRYLLLAEAQRGSVAGVVETLGTERHGGGTGRNQGGRGGTGEKYGGTKVGNVIMGDANVKVTFFAQR